MTRNLKAILHSPSGFSRNAAQNSRGITPYWLAVSLGVKYLANTDDFQLDATFNDWPKL
jgi:hypothetical protein